MNEPELIELHAHWDLHDPELVLTNIWRDSGNHRYMVTVNHPDRLAEQAFIELVGTHRPEVLLAILIDFYESQGFSHTASLVRAALGHLTAEAQERFVNSFGPPPEDAPVEPQKTPSN